MLAWQLEVIIAEENAQGKEVPGRGLPVSQDHLQAKSHGRRIRLKAPQQVDDVLMPLATGFKGRRGIVILRATCRHPGVQVSRRGEEVVDHLQVPGGAGIPEGSPTAVVPPVGVDPRVIQKDGGDGQMTLFTGEVEGGGPTSKAIHDVDARVREQQRHGEDAIVKAGDEQGRRA